MNTRPNPPHPRDMFRDDRSAAPEIADAHPPDPDPPASGEDSTYTPHETAGEEFNDHKGPGGMPPLAETTLTDTHSFSRLLATFSDRLVIARTQASDLRSIIYVVDPDSGLVSSNRDHVQALSMQVADHLVADYEDLAREIQLADDETRGPEDLPPLPGRRTGTRGWWEACWSTT